eukprot:scaffold173660_cov24-Tisochrysis_lutea.AAC.2
MPLRCTARRKLAELALFVPKEAPKVCARLTSATRHVIGKLRLFYGQASCSVAPPTNALVSIMQRCIAKGCAACGFPKNPVDDRLENEDEELRCVIAIARHGDRTPKQKLKINITQPCLLEL